ncbi:hypothetical protein CU254_05540 [Amycolatopsis sp. AA4]|uniref:hypothetical protein n=1 Tax=Actinomycetes TaxID=1760 RepID=UPI0001B53F5C|nr:MULTISPECIES: hypothetical protein [Actinomycetes]ATY09984.1 hypothetical protein CU254_05540 [Amycolatopsis sp. AA4]EFL05407.1 predicted protein [Streptomyces sp. AA4]
MIVFGVWPGVVSADLVRLETFIDAPPEDVERTAEALRDLAKGTERFYVRCYRSYRGPHEPTPPDPVPYLGDGRVVDYVLGYGSPEADPDGFADAVRAAVREVAELGGGKLQVCEEVNVAAPLDGGSPGCYEALGAGLAAALDERTRLGVDVTIGFNAAVALPGDPFWAAVRAAVDPEVLARVDFLGLDFFPDVFRPVPADALAGAVTHVVRSYRESASAIGIPESVPIHITETGWPTGPENSEERQVQVMESVARTVFGLAAEAGVDTYEIFGLRDGLSSGPRENRFGLLRDDYSPKPAYETVKRLIAEYSS